MRHGLYQNAFRAQMLTHVCNLENAQLSAMLQKLGIAGSRNAHLGCAHETPLRRAPANVQLLMPQACIVLG